MMGFIAGFLCAFAICAGAAYAYYRRAKRRVRSIERAIINYQNATKTVSSACDKVYR